MQSQKGRMLGVIGLIASFVLPLATAADEAVGSTMNIQTVKIINQVCEAVISVKPFVHLISFRFIGGKNHLLNFESPNPVHNGRSMRPAFVVGAKLWFAPETPGSHLLGLLSGSITHSEREVIAQLDPDPCSELQGSICFHLDEHEPRLTITSVLKNVGTVEKETSCWWPVSFEPGGRMKAELLPLSTEPVFNFHFWSYGGTASEPACKIDKKWVVLDMDRPLQEPIFKMGFLGGEILLTKPDCAYRLRALNPLPDPQLKYPHCDSPVMLYCDQKTLFCEAELSGPLIKLHPNEKTSFTFSISLEAPKKE